MSLQSNKALVQRFIDEIMNAGNTAAINDYCIPGSMFAGGIEGQIKVLRTAFPDHTTTVDEMVAEGDKVAVHVTFHGTNTGPMLGFPAFGRLETPVPPAGRTASGTGMYLFTLSEGKIVRYAFELDQIGLLRQLGWTFTPPGSLAE